MISFVFIGIEVIRQLCDMRIICSICSYVKRLVTFLYTTNVKTACYLKLKLNIKYDHFPPYEFILSMKHD